MNWYKYYIECVGASEVIPFNPDPDDNDDIDYDPYEYGEQAEKVLRDSVGVNRNKNVSYVAVEDGRVIGAVASGWSKNDSYGDEEMWVFEFDVAVSPQYRKPPNLTGLKLIQEAINHYEREKHDYQSMGARTMMRLWVVNPRLVQVMERRYGFEIEGQHGDGSAHMIRY